MTTMVSVRIPQDWKESLEEIMEQEGKESVSEVIKELIKARTEIFLNPPETEDPTALKGSDMVQFEKLVDEVIRLENRRRELKRLIAQSKQENGFFSFGGIPAHLEQALEMCGQRLKQITNEMKTRFPEREDSEKDGPKEVREYDQIL